MQEHLLVAPSGSRCARPKSVTHMDVGYAGKAGALSCPYDFVELPTARFVAG
jgi:hypothetical protein